MSGQPKGPLPQVVVLCEACDTIEVFESLTGAPRQCAAFLGMLLHAFWRLWERDNRVR